MKPKAHEKEQWYSELPAIRSCLIVDSRFSSRRDFLNGLRDTKLFLDVIEAESVDDARERLIGGWFDACLLGPSIKQKTCDKLISRTRGLVHSNSCAFMVFTNSREKTNDEILGWAHKVCRSPGSALELAEAIVVAVLSANTQSVWKDAVLSIRPELVKEAAEASSLRQKILISSKDKSVKGMALDFSIDSILTETYSILDKLIEEYSGIRGALGKDGGVRPEAIRDVRSATDALFEGFITTPDILSYKKYFATTLLETLIRVSIEGKEEAVREFRRSILNRA